MSESNFIDQLKKIKKLKDENREKVEKIRNVDLENKKKVINCKVNISIIEKLINDGIVFDPKEENGELVWIYPNGERLSLSDSIKLLKLKLESGST